MHIVPGRVVAIHYSVRLDDGSVLASSEGNPPLSYLHGHEASGLGVEGVLAGRGAGEEFDLTLPPAEAFGERDPKKVRSVPRAAFPETVRLAEGGRYTTTTQAGKKLSFAVVRIEPDVVVLDFNHPLAGKTVVLSLKVVQVREATPEELKQGRAL